VVLVAVAALFKPESLKELWRSDRSELVVVMAALLGGLGWSPLAVAVTSRGTSVPGEVELLAFSP